MLNYIKRHLNKNFITLIFIDFTLINLALYLSILVRYDFIINDFLFNYLNYEKLILFNLVKIFSFKLFFLYRGMWRFTSIWDVFNIIKANIFASSTIVFLIYMSNGFQNISRTLFIVDFLFCLFFIGTTRVGIRLFFGNIISVVKNYQIENNRTRILLIGAGYAGQEVARQILSKHSSNFVVVGFIDDDNQKYKAQVHGIPVVGDINHIQKIVSEFDEIYVCIPSASSAELQNIVNECRASGKPFKILPSLSELINSKISISQLRDFSILDLLGRDEVNLNKNSIKNLLNGKRVLITGAGGSIGSELVRQCMVFKPSILILFEISEFNLFQIERELIESDSKILFKPLLGDIRDDQCLRRTFNEYKPQIVFHAAAYKHVPMQENFPWEAIKTNMFSTLNLSKLSIEFEVEKFVLVSTDKAVNPTNVMGATKRLAEIITQYHNELSENTDFISVRFGNVLGSSGSVIPIFKKQIKKGGPLTVTDPDMERYFMSIPEASQLILQSCALGNGGEIFILDMGNPIKIVDLAEELIRLSGLEPGLDISIKFTGTRPGEKKFEELSHSHENLDKTKHDKIFILSNSYKSEISSIETMEKIKKLSNLIQNNDIIEIKYALSKILPEYIPEDIEREQKISKLDVFNESLKAKA